MITSLSLHNEGSFFYESFNIPRFTICAMDTCIETNEKIAFGMEEYSRNMPSICWFLEYGRHIPGICQTYDTIQIPDAGPDSPL
jgi:hypothetical protein